LLQALGRSVSLSTDIGSLSVDKPTGVGDS